MNKGTKLRTILAVASCLNTALLATDITGFNNPKLDMAYKIISLILNFIIVAIATYFNNDYTDTACEYTGLMRQAKEEESSEYEGEEFFTSIDVAEDEVDEDEE